MRRISAKKILFGVAVFCAWFFLISTLGTLAYMFWIQWPGVDSQSQIMSTMVDGERYTGLGFGYRGVGGLVLIVVETGFVLAATIMSVLRQPRWRRIGHGALIAWAALWLGNTIYLMSIDGSVFWITGIVLYSFFLLCTIIRAAGARRRASPHEAAQADVAA
jgi:hypothetical protein